MVGTKGTPMNPCGLEGAGEGWQQAPLNKWMGRACALLPKHPCVRGSVTCASGLLRMESSIWAAAQPQQPLGDGSMCCFGAARLPAVSIEGVSQHPQAWQCWWEMLWLAEGALEQPGLRLAPTTPLTPRLVPTPQLCWAMCLWGRALEWVLADSWPVCVCGWGE